MAYQKEDSTSLKKLQFKTFLVERAIQLLLRENPDDLIIYVEINDLANNGKLLNNVKKIVKHVSREVPSTNLAFSYIIVRKEKQKLDKKLMSHVWVKRSFTLVTKVKLSLLKI